MFTGVSNYRLLVEVRTGPGHQECPAHLAQPLVGNSDHRGVGHSLHPGQYLLDLGGVDVESAADVHVLEPVGDAQVAGVVHGADVAGVQPAVGVDGGGGGVGGIEVAQHDIRPAQQHFPVFGTC